MASYTSSHKGSEIDNAVKNANLMLITGAADPDATTVGTLGQLYQNTTDGTIFRCSNIVGTTYTWTELTDYSLAEKTKVTNATTNIGTLASLTTTEKSNLVGAISEVDAAVDANSTQISQLDEQFKSKAAQESAALGAELLGADGWTSDGWTGDFATGFTHTTGNASVLSFNLGATGTNLYQVEFDVSSAIDISLELQVRVGGSIEFSLYGHPGTHVSCGIKSVSDGLLEFVPATGFIKTISNISCKQITAARAATTIIKTNDAANSIEFYPTLAALKNLFIGINSGKLNTAGYGNLGIGADTLAGNTSGFWNVGIGYQSLLRNTVGSRNVAIGYTALSNNVSGMRNQAIGSFSMHNNTTGYENISIGSDSMNDNTTGYDNVAIGFQAMYHSTVGYNNVALGKVALASITDGVDNVGVGKASLTAITTGKYNIGIGSTAGDNITTGQSNICIGYGTDAPSATRTNSLNIANTIYGNTGTGKQIGIGVASPTAHMHLKAGEETAGRAPLKIDAGALLSTAEAGAVEFDGTNLYFTDSTGARKTLAVVS